MNYTILVVPGALILLWIYWHLSVKHWFTGPKTTVDLPAGVTVGRRDRGRARAPHPQPRRLVDHSGEPNRRGSGEREWARGSR